MDNKKEKRQHPLPNRELARVFNFTSEDLSANRLGFITREQQWNIPVLMRPITHKFFSLLPLSQRDKVDHVCGKINIEMAQIPHDRVRNSHSGWTHERVLTVSGGYSLVFVLSNMQFDMLSNYLDIPHHIYYIYRGDYRSRIVAIELALHGC